LSSFHSPVLSCLRVMKLQVIQECLLPWSIVTTNSRGLHWKQLEGPLMQDFHIHIHCRLAGNVLLRHLCYIPLSLAAQCNSLDCLWSDVRSMSRHIVGLLE
jgi:hypothetical protein